jgi:hypothetical protein
VNNNINDYFNFREHGSNTFSKGPYIRRIPRQTVLIVIGILLTGSYNMADELS